MELLRKPLWIVGALVALIGVIVFVGLGMWQLRRHDERAALNQTIAQRLSVTPTDLASLIIEVSGDADRLAWHRVTAEGSYTGADEVILAGRSHRPVAGHNVLTPLEIGAGAAVVVNRGWIPIDATGAPGAEPGPRVVTGILLPDEGPRLLGGGQGPVDQIGSIDLERLDDQTSTSLLPVYLQLESQEPTADGAPQILPAPTLGSGPHLSYAIQWFLFATIVLVGFPALIYRTSAVRFSRSGTPSTPSSEL